MARKRKLSESDIRNILEEMDKMSVDDSSSECETDNNYESSDENYSEQSADKSVGCKNESPDETPVNYSSLLIKNN